ncbi:membrane protein [Chitinilyticum litopenaei]|uniref:membrane protein n=1 Tax=Chitinilyticum litopenaei TaxID=1121276 RepID=UPI00041E6E69|nr:membrane protein [Chitinilyticum litopenaei]
MLWQWFDRNILSLGRELRLSYLPPLLVYLAFGIQGLTGIVGTFYVKERLGLSAEFLAALGFWVGIPFALKMPIGHLVDLLWRFKSGLIYLGAALLAASLLIMAALIGDPQAMAGVMSVNAWYVLATLLLPIGFVLQDAVADAMTVEAVPRHAADGTPLPEAQIKLMHTTMQTLGRVAVIGGSVLVAGVNVWLFAGSESLDEAGKTALYRQVYLLALVIPLISVLGVILNAALQRRRLAAHRAQGLSAAEARALLNHQDAPARPNWWVLGGSLAFVAFTLTMGLNQLRYGQEAVFLGSLAIIGFLLWRLLRELEPPARVTLLGTALVIFMYRATPSGGAGVSWWMIDELGFDPAFLSKLSLLGSCLTLVGMFVFRRFMAERPLFVVIAFLTIAGTVLSLPTLAMSYGFHDWTAAHTGGVVDARFIAIIDTALESPLGQIAMIPMLAWIANSAPAQLKATFFAVMASFTNLALSASQLGTKYLNQIFTLSREVKDPASGLVLTAANYSELSPLLWTVGALGLLLPGAALLLAWKLKLRSA